MWQLRVRTGPVGEQCVSESGVAADAADGSEGIRLRVQVMCASFVGLESGTHLTVTCSHGWLLRRLVGMAHDQRISLYSG